MMKLIYDSFLKTEEGGQIIFERVYNRYEKERADTHYCFTYSKAGSDCRNQ